MSQGEDNAGAEDEDIVNEEDPDDADPPSRASSSPGSDADYEIISHGDLNGDKSTTS